jgi:serine/threonine-protein kinase
MARYQLIRKLATGGMAEVFLGRAIGSGGFQKPVAIKRILPHLGADKEFVTRFNDEARLTVHLQHANVVQVFDLGRTTRDHVMVLEFVDGVTLRELLREARLKHVELPLREMIFVVQQVAEGLAYAHEATGPDRTNLNIIHRDINPSNVMVSSAGEVKLADFGIARAAMVQSSTAAGVVRGKIGYFPPEVAKGSDNDQRSDVFLMGVMLYESVTQRKLFKEHDFVKSLVEVSQFELGPLQRPDHVPEPLWAIVLSALHPDPAQRVASARELSLKLSSYLFDNRMRVGPTDVAQLFAKVFPERRSALHDLEGSPVMAEVNLAADPSGSTVRVAPAPSPAPLPPVLVKEKENDFVPPPPVPPRPGSGRPAHVPTPLPSRPGMRTKMRLGELLVAHKLITPEQLDHGLKMQRRMGQQLGDVLVSLKFVSEDDLYSTLAEQKGHRFVRTSKLESFDVSDHLKTLVPRELAEKLRVVPLSLDEKRQLFIAMRNPGDLAVLDEVRVRSDVPRVIGVMIRPRTLDRLIDRVYLNKAVDLELPEWATEQEKLVERFGSKTSDAFTKSPERIFGEEDLATPSNSVAELLRPETNGSGHIPSMLDLVAGAAATREDAIGQQVLRLMHVVRGLCARVGVEGQAAVAVERQAVALFMAGQLEDRHFYEPPCIVTVKQLLAGFPPREDAFLVYTAEQRATAKVTTAPQQVLAAVFSLAFKLGDLDAPAEKVAAALVEVQGQGWVPPSVVSALSQLMQTLPAAVAIIASPGSVLFAVAPALTRLGHRVVASRTDCLERARPSRVIVDATMHSPGALELVQRAVKLGAKVAAVAPPQVVGLIAPWKSNAVSVLSTEDLRAVVAWVRQS